MDAMATAEITAQLNLGAGVEIALDDALEVSLDCPGCGRVRRTIIFHKDRATAICTPTRHPVAGRILEHACHVEANQALIRYLITYPTGAFSDPKHPIDSVPHPTWARINYRLTCPGCQTVTECSTQNNLTRPWTQRCGCGHTLVDESRENPQFRLLGPAGETLYEQRASAYALWLDPGAPRAIIAELARILDLAPAQIVERAAQRQPIFEHQLFAHSPPDADPAWPYQALQAAAFLLLRTGTGFDITGVGRSLKPNYAYQLRTSAD